MIRFSVSGFVNDTTADMAEAVSVAKTDTAKKGFGYTEAAGLPNWYQDDFRVYVNEYGNMNGEVDPYRFVADYAVKLSRAATDVQAQVGDAQGTIPYSEIIRLPERFRCEAMRYVMKDLNE